MNATRRKEIAKLIVKVYDLQDAIDDLVSDIQSVLDEEQEAYDNLPESIQESCKGEVMQNAIYSLEEALGYLDIDVEDFTSYLEDAMA